LDSGLMANGSYGVYPVTAICFVANQNLATKKPGETSPGF